MLSINKRRYTETFLDSQIHSLSERYQLSENIKTTLLLCPLIVLNLTGNLICILLAFLYIFLYGQSTESSEKSARAIYHVFSLLTAICSAFFPVFSIFGHPEMGKRAKMILICFRRGASVVPVCDSDLKNAVGTSLIIHRKNERELHFAALNEMWN